MRPFKRKKERLRKFRELAELDFGRAWGSSGEDLADYKFDIDRQLDIFDENENGWESYESYLGKRRIKKRYDSA